MAVEQESMTILPPFKECTEPSSLYRHLLKKYDHSKPATGLPPVYVPQEDFKSTSSQALSELRKGDLPSYNCLPRLTYENGDGLNRNLPKHAELLRILAKLDLNRGNVQLGFTHDGVDLSYYSDDEDIYRQDTTEENQKKRKRRGKKCSFCHKAGGKHQKWCVNYSAPDEKTPSLSRSKTEVSLKFVKKPKEAEIKPPKLRRSQTMYEPPPPDPNRPDYSTLHRDVYIRALANAQARRLMKQKYDFEFSISRPHVFSYFDLLGEGSNTFNEMKRIFGNELDFTRYYKDILKEKEQQKQNVS